MDRSLEHLPSGASSTVEPPADVDRALADPRTDGSGSRHPLPHDPAPRAGQHETQLAEPCAISGALRDADREPRSVLLEAVTNNATLGLFVMDERQHCTFMNPAAEALTGFTLAEVQGRPLHEFVHHTRPDGTPYPLEECPIDRAFPQNLREQGEEIFVHKNGSFYPVAFTASPIREGGRTVGTVIEVQNIAAQKQAEAMLRSRVQQQAAVAFLGQQALGRVAVQTLLEEAVKLVAQTLGVEYCKVLELLPDGNALLLRAGVGWREGLVGLGTVSAGRESQAGYTLLASEPVIVEDLRAETRFSGPPLLHDHGVVSGLSCIIPGPGRPYGVLGAHTAERRTFTRDDVNFLQSVAHVLAAAIEREQAERERAELLAREQATREQLDAILRGVTDGITVQAPDGRLVYANDAAAGFAGFASAEEFVATPLSEVLQRFEMLDETGQPFPLERLPGQRALQGEKVGDTPIRFRVRATGEERWSLVAATPLRDGAGQVRLAINIFHDVTEQKRTEQRLQFLAQSGALLPASLDMGETTDALARAAVATLADWALVYLVEEGTIERIALAHTNPAQTALVEEIRRHYPPVPGDQSLIWRVLQTGESILVPEVSAELVRRVARSDDHARLIRALGVASLIYVPLAARGRVLGVLGLFTSQRGGRRLTQDDLTVAEEIARRAALALDNVRLYQQAHEAVRARDEFLSIASHELRNPVAGISGTAQLLRRTQERGQLDPERLERYLANIEQTGARLAALTDDLLDVSRLQRGAMPLRLRPADLGALVRDAVTRAAPQAPGHQFPLTLESEPCVALIDPDRIEQIVTNLLDNAVKYSPAGGEIRVSLTAEQGELVLRVRDAGIGLPPGTEEKIFEPFGRAPNAAARNIPGLGLGLYICRRIAEQHGGRLWAESAGEEAGTTLVLRLPGGSGAA